MRFVAYKRKKKTRGLLTVESKLMMHAIKPFDIICQNLKIREKSTSITFTTLLLWQKKKKKTLETAFIQIS